MMNASAHRHAPRRHLQLWTVVLIAAAFVATLLTAGADIARAAPTLLSQGRPATASSSEGAAMGAGAAVDGNTGTRWSSAFSDPQWIQVDLGSAQAISQVVLNWEAAYGRAFTPISGQRHRLDHDPHHHHRHRRRADHPGDRHRPLRPAQRHRPRHAYGYSLWEFQIYGTTTTPDPACGTSNAAQGRPATASSTENAATPGSAAVDGNTGTRWASAFSDPQWLQVDLGASTGICQVVLNWEAAYASGYQLQTSTDATTWTTIHTTTTGTGGTQTLNVTGTGRYVRINATTRATPYGY